MIRTERIDLDVIPEFDRIFFASKNGVQHFFEQDQGPAIARADAVGIGTASALRAKGVAVDFIGDGPDTTVIGQQYAAEVGLGKVLFVTAEQGSRKIQRSFEVEKRVELIVYRTVAEESVRPIDTDILVFTSPSNAIAYFENNKHRFVHTMGC